ncbi:PaaI family thioesterase [Sneathiella sp.]|jgi:acyl-coenzyme A thioesterase PaaI-like protein|uniref:PaaI family thioesterase n=1 Tax=Sneathiella sp. TaxID=1964365 RepID=UPI0025FB4C41|nr:PaaI family thioesterase [Sneathiella sp.]
MTLSPIPEGFRPFTSRGRYTEKIGPLYYREEGDSFTYGFLADEGHANANGIVHGGMLISFLDEALGQIIWRSVDRQRCATISLNCDFVASAKPGDWIETRATISKRGLAVVFIRGELVVGDRTILIADGIWKIIGK